MTSILLIRAHFLTCSILLDLTQSCSLREL
jgi:hypothetical protein